MPARSRVVLLDIHLPDITGFEVVRRVSGGPGRPAIVLISSHDASDFGRRIERSGARGFIAKAELSALGRLTKVVLGGALEGEMDAYLGSAEHDRAGRDGGSSRDGRRAGAVLISAGSGRGCG